VSVIETCLSTSWNWQSTPRYFLLNTAPFGCVRVYEKQPIFWLYHHHHHGWCAGQRAWQLVARHSARRNNRPHADVLAVWRPKLSGLRSASTVHSQNWHGLLGQCQSSGRRLTEARSACAWSWAGSAWAIWPNSFIHRNFAREVTGGWPVLEQTSWLMTCAMNISQAPLVKGIKTSFGRRESSILFYQHNAYPSLTWYRTLLRLLMACFT